MTLDPKTLRTYYDPTTPDPMTLYFMTLEPFHLEEEVWISIR